MLTGALVLALFTWSERAISIFDRIANSRFLKRFTGGIMGKLEEYKESSHKTRSSNSRNIRINNDMLDSERFRMVLLRSCLRNNNHSNFAIAWLGFFLIHPLVTALAFVPITPAGAGVQEFGIVGILGLLFVNPSTADVRQHWSICNLGTWITNLLKTSQEYLK